MPDLADPLGLPVRGNYGNTRPEIIHGKNNHQLTIIRLAYHSCYRGIITEVHTCSFHENFVTTKMSSHETDSLDET